MDGVWRDERQYEWEGGRTRASIDYTARHIFHQLNPKLDKGMKGMSLTVTQGSQSAMFGTYIEFNGGEFSMA